jgi:hypothetical protein
MKTVRAVILCLFFLLLIGGLAAQEFSEKQDLSIFRLNYYGAPPAPVPETIRIRAEIGNASVDIRLQGSGNIETDRIFQETIVGVDAEIRQVFQNLGRFNVITYPQRISTENLDAFLSAIREYREARVEIPEAVRLGREAFTEQDLNRIVDSFIMVVPTVTYYQLNRDDDLNWEARIITNFSIINVQDYRTIAEFSVESSGYDDDPQVSMRSAVDGIAGQLDFEVRSIEEFKIRTAILERTGRQIIVAFGADMGIQVGDEYEVTRPREVAGYTVDRRIALLRIREVSREFSVAQIIYENKRAEIGDQVKEMPRAGLDVSPYVAGLLDLGGSGLESFAIGVKASPNRGVYAFRPLIGAEILFSQTSTSGPLVGLPVSLNIGAEYNIFLGRLRLIPQAYFGLIGQVPLDESEEFSLRSLKTSALIGAAYLLPGGDDSLELYLESGYEIQFGLASSRNVQGFLFGGGVRFR